MLMALTQVFRKESQVVTARFVFRFAIFPRSGFFLQLAICPDQK